MSDVFRFTGSPIDMEAWCKAHRIPSHEGRQRYAGYVVLVENRFGIKLKTQSVKRNPKGRTHTFQTYQIAVGYQFRGDRHYANFENSLSNTCITVEITFNGKYV